MTDVAMVNEPDGGNVTITNGTAVLADGVFNAVYFSLFGGDEQDSGGDEGVEKQWWANVLEQDPALQLRSRTQHLLQTLALIPANLSRIEDAARADLEWMVGTIADEVDVFASITAVNTVKVSGAVVIDGTRYPFDFVKNKTQ